MLPQSTTTLRVWNIINPPSSPTYYPVESPEHAGRLIDALADSQLLESDIEANVFGLVQLVESGEWEDWYSEEGDDFETWWDNFKEAANG